MQPAALVALAGEPVDPGFELAAPGIERDVLGLERAQLLARRLERPGLLLPAYGIEGRRPLARQRQQPSGTVAAGDGADLGRDRGGEPIMAAGDALEVAERGRLVDPEQGLHTGILRPGSPRLPALEAQQFLQAALGSVVLQPLAVRLQHDARAPEGLAQPEAAGRRTRTRR